MNIRTFLAGLVLALPAASAPAIDFTARFADYMDDAVPIRRMYFTDGARRIYYRPLFTWSRSGDDKAAVFRPKESKNAMVKIQNAPDGDCRIAFDARGLEAFRKAARALVPAEAEELTQIWETVNPVVLQGWTSFEVGFDYLHSGQRFCRSILFINLDGKRQIHLIVDAEPAEFDPLYKAAYKSLGTWWEPSDVALD